MRDFVTSFFRYATEHGYNFSTEKTAEFLGLLNDLKAGPSHMAEELRRYQEIENKVAARKKEEENQMVEE